MKELKESKAALQKELTVPKNDEAKLHTDVSEQGILSAENDNGMLYARGWVQFVEGESAYVTTERETGCSGCQSKKGCGTATLAQLFSPNSKVPIEIVNHLNAKEGDEVVLSMDQSHLIKHSLMAYGVPLLGLFSLGLLGQWLVGLTQFHHLQDVAAIVSGAAGLAFGWLITRQFYQPALPLLHKIVPSQ